VGSWMLEVHALFDVLLHGGADFRFINNSRVA
jgi:hypothetical protein